MTERGARPGTWLALLASLLLGVAWWVQERRADERASEARAEVRRLEAAVTKCRNLQKVEAELAREVGRIEAQLEQVTRIVPRDAEGWRSALMADAAGRGLRLLESRILDVQELSIPTHRRLIARVRIEPAPAGWSEALAGIDQWPLILLIRRLEVEDPRRAGSEVVLEVASFIRSGPTQENAGD